MRPPQPSSCARHARAGLLSSRWIAALLLLAAAVTVPPLRAQNNPPAKDEGKDNGQKPSPGEKWQDLEKRQRPPAARMGGRETKKTPEQRRQETADSRTYFLSIADEAKNFRAENPGHPKAAAARLLEAQSLLKAQMLGDKTQETRATALVEQVRRDSSLPSKDRYDVVMMAEHLLSRSVARTRGESAVAREESGRYLINEFPAEAGGYMTMLQAADNAEDIGKVQAVAREIKVSPAPFAAKAQAQIVAERYELIGKSLADVANTALGRGNFFEQCRNRRVLLYTWGAESKQSITYAKEIVGKAPPGVLVIGFNLDRNVVAAKALAAEHKLPGQHYYNEGGIGSWPALLLKLNATPLVYLTDEQGIIRDVNGQRGVLADRIAAKRNR